MWLSPVTCPLMMSPGKQPSTIPKAPADADQVMDLQQKLAAMEGVLETLRMKVSEADKRAEDGKTVLEALREEVRQLWDASRARSVAPSSVPHASILLEPSGPAQMDLDKKESTPLPESPTSQKMDVDDGSAMVTTASRPLTPPPTSRPVSPSPTSMPPCEPSPAPPSLDGEKAQLSPLPSQLDVLAGYTSSPAASPHSQEPQEHPLAMVMNMAFGVAQTLNESVEDPLNDES